MHIRNINKISPREVYPKHVLDDRFTTHVQMVIKLLKTEKFSGELSVIYRARYSYNLSHKESLLLDVFLKIYNTINDHYDTLDVVCNAIRHFCNTVEIKEYLGKFKPYILKLTYNTYFIEILLVALSLSLIELMYNDCLILADDDNKGNFVSLSLDGTGQLPMTNLDILVAYEELYSAKSFDTILEFEECETYRDVMRISNYVSGLRGLFISCLSKEEELEIQYYIAKDKIVTFMYSFPFKESFEGMSYF